MPELSEPEILLPSQFSSRIERLEVLSEWLDSKFEIPGTDIKFGLDFLIGLLPGIGDTITSLISSYLIKEAHDMKAPMGLKVKMAFNIFIDWFFGIIPFIGDIFDIGYKANTKNVKMLKEFLAENG